MPAWIVRILAGLETGVIGGLLMLFFYSSGSLLSRQAWWSVENLFGTAVYGPAALWKGLGRATLAGSAVQILIAAISGIFCALALSARRDPWVVRVASGLLWGLGTYYTAYELILPRVGPMIPLYSARMAPIVAHILLGITLTRVQPVYRHISRQLSPLPDPAEHSSAPR